MYPLATVRRVRDSNSKWELTRSLHFYKYNIVVPADFITDGASIPRIAWIWKRPTGKHFEAAIVHDYLYETHKFSRKRSDQIFYKLMLKYGVKRHRAYIMYKAVRIFSKVFWDRHG